MYYCQTIVACNLAVWYRVLKSVVLHYYSSVKPVQLVVAHVELCLAQRGIVEEEATAEIIYGFLGLRKELVRDEGNVVACLAEKFREERIITPFTAVAYGMERKYVLEYEARQVPARNNIVKNKEFAIFLPFQLLWCGFVFVAVELRVMLVIALTHYEHYVWTAIVTGINSNLLCS